MSEFAVGLALSAVASLTGLMLGIRFIGQERASRGQVRAIAALAIVAVASYAAVLWDCGRTGSCAPERVGANVERSRTEAFGAARAAPGFSGGANVCK